MKSVNVVLVGIPAFEPVVVASLLASLPVLTFLFVPLSYDLTVFAYVQRSGVLTLGSVPIVVSYLVPTSGAVKPFVLVPRTSKRLVRLCSAVPRLCVPRSKDPAFASVPTCGAPLFPDAPTCAVTAFASVPRCGVLI
jgi:hypothetical protein|uniref:Uncharacterized protein n=1 Tax=Picea glauca TaxID=3330 RepID=A0A101LU96_PICGL|nr:hypothetical protein ABT39_MTgene2578 [Picea glauca]QHR87097.1 hypothetical protein Q903MT_gene1106 [Picea sitchensis]